MNDREAKIRDIVHNLTEDVARHDAGDNEGGEYENNGLSSSFPQGTKFTQDKHGDARTVIDPKLIRELSVEYSRVHDIFDIMGSKLDALEHYKKEDKDKIDIDSTERSLRKEIEQKVDERDLEPV